MNKTLLLGVVSIMLIGCGNNTMRSLEQLETRIDHVPDLVLHELSSMDGTIKWGEARALHALLTVRAQDKCDLLTGNDSLITIATNYYSKHGNPERRLFAHIYAGRVYSAAGNSQKAIELYTEALKYKDQTDNYYALGLLYSDIAKEYSWAYDYAQAIENMEKSLNYYGQAGKERHQILAKSSLGLYYLNSNNYVEAERYLTEVLAWGELNDDEYFVKNTLGDLCSLYDETRNYEKLSKIYTAYPLEKLEQNSRNYGIASFYYIQQNNPEQANELLQKAWDLSKTPTDTSFLWHREYKINNNLGDYKNALINFKHLFYYHDSLLGKTLQQPLLKAQRDYYQSELQLSEIKNQNRRLTIVLLSFSTLLIFFIPWFIYKNRVRMREDRIREHVDALNELRYKLSKKDEQMNETVQALQTQKSNARTLEIKLSELFHEQYKMLNDLCATYYANSKNKNKIVQEFESVVEGFSGNDYFKLEELINKYKNDVIFLLRRELPNFKENDYKLICYFCAGFSIKTISVITKKKEDTLWVYKGRLIKKILESDAPSKGIILANIPQNTKTNS
ncbi:MAG: tetratricopeptide repeat protein [Bacteroidaceae bacterium]|nr:tetratricopeptide repeat protein [Bacteroidaceae bacterium]